jgi:pSer/pThr/pTyr-binding forkhead associated (FHA) protein
MLVKLIMLHGKLQERQSRKVKEELRIRQSPFVIGTASDCSMRCLSKRISPYHCQLLIEPENVILQDLSSQTGTFVNGQAVKSSVILKNGDRFRVGRLEFQTLIEDPTPVWEVGPRVDGDTIHDIMSDTVCNLLSAADEEDRKRRLQNPELRQFSLPPAGKQSAQRGAGPTERNGNAGSTASKRPAKKLPAHVRCGGDSSVAAAKALQKHFSRVQAGRENRSHRPGSSPESDQ